VVAIKEEDIATNTLDDTVIKESSTEPEIPSDIADELEDILNDIDINGVEPDLSLTEIVLEDDYDDWE